MGYTDLSLHEPFDIHWHAVGFGFVNELRVYLEDAEFDNVFHRENG